MKYSIKLRLGLNIIIVYDKGFALFFHTHICNDICKSLGLSQFDLAPAEILANQTHTSVDSRKNNVSTRTREDVEPLFFAGNVKRKYHASECESVSEQPSESHSPTSGDNLRMSSSSDLHVNVFSHSEYGLSRGRDVYLLSICI